MPQVKVYSKKKLIMAKTFQQAWQEARNKGLATFSYKGNDYNTKKAGESDAQWAKFLKGKGNTAIGAKAQYRVHYKGQDATINERTGTVSKVNGGGYYATDTSGKVLKRGFNTKEEALAWIRKNTNNKGGRVFSEQKLTSAPYADLSAKASGKVTVTSGGTNNGTTTSRKTNNRGTTITVGKSPKGTPRTPDKTNSSDNAKADRLWGNNGFSVGRFTDAFFPSSAVGGGIDLATGDNLKTYPSGWNPFGYTEDIINGDWGRVGLRALDLWSSLGAPGASAAIDWAGTRFAPMMGTFGPKSFFAAEKATTPIVDANGQVVGRTINPWSWRSITGNFTSPVKSYGQRSVQRAINEGATIPLAPQAERWAPNAILNMNTGTTYFFNNPGLHPYDAAVESAMQLAPWMMPALSVSEQQVLNNL